MYILYGGRFTRTLMTEMVMAEGGLTYELREIDIVRHEHRSPEYLKINPAGWVPALITPNGQTIHEMAAINLYLAEQHELAHLVPDQTDSERGAFLSGFMYVADELEPALKRYYYPHRYVVREDDTPVMKQMALDAVAERFAVINKRLRSRGPYYLGDRFSLIDLMVTYWACSVREVEIFEDLDGITRCTGLVRSRPLLTAKFEQLGEWIADYDRAQANGEGVV